MKKLKMILIYTLYTLFTLIILTTLFVNFAPTFGDSPKNGNYKKIQESKNFQKGKFQNLVSTSVGMNGSNELTPEDGTMMSFFNPPKDKNPQKPVPSIKFEKDNFLNSSDDKFAWFGHSTILMKLNGTTVITDPVFNRASPLPIFGKPFNFKHKPQIEELPQIDVVVISHDHYDHLDHRGIQELDEKVNNYLVPLGVKAHLVKWGVNENKIYEFDWYEDKIVDNIKFTFTPSRHFSGRGLTNRDSTLWGGWAIKSKDNNVFFTGDTGYFDEFKNIGEILGPFNISFIECGAYNIRWKDIHMMPEQSVQTGLDLNSEIAFPIHWGKFDLSVHKWTEPIERFSEEAKKKNLKYTTPKVGEIFTLNNLSKDHWWE